MHCNCTFEFVVSLLGMMPVSIIAFKSIFPDLSNGMLGGFVSLVRVEEPPMAEERPYMSSQM
jgi:hypothetical protein